MLFQRIHLASIVEWYAKQALSNIRSLQSMRPMSLGNAVPRQHDAINSYPTNRTLTNQMAHVRVCVSVWSHHCHKALCAVKDSQSVI